MIEEIAREDLLGAVDRAVADVLAAAGVSAPPVDAVALAVQHLGLTIRHDDRARRRTVKPDDRHEIVLPAGLSAEQTQSAVARALGALQKPAILCGLGVPPEEQKRLLGASLPELFAERLLVPTAWLNAEARALDFDVLALQRRFATAAVEVIAGRLLDLPEPCVIAIVSNDIVVSRRSNAWRVNRQLSVAERECQRRVDLADEPVVLRADGWTVQGWPVPRADGKRALLRGVMDE